MNSSMLASALSSMLLLAFPSHAFLAQYTMLRPLSPAPDLRIPSSLLSFGSEQGLHVGLIESGDVGHVADLLADAFPFDISISETDFGPWEREILGGPLKLVNAYLRGFSYFEILLGIKARLGSRLENPSLQKCEQALLLAVQEPTTKQLIATVELEWRIPDGKLPGNFPMPVVFQSSYKMKQSISSQQQQHKVPQPYLCNLAVATPWRGQKIGKQLVRLAEHIVRMWGAETVYLHVDASNEVALQLYTSMGYKPAPKPQLTFMDALMGVPNVDYFCKRLSAHGAETTLPVPQTDSQSTKTATEQIT